MDTIEGGDSCNQTLFEYYDIYLQEWKQLMGHHVKKYREEFIGYFEQNAQHLAVGIIIYVLFSFCFYCFVIRTKLVGTIADCKNVLFVTSHPDDECMFFGPAIVTLCSRPDCSIYLLCLSRDVIIVKSLRMPAEDVANETFGRGPTKGNFKNLGRIRKKELFDSCKILNLPEYNIQIINSSVLPDDPKISWNQEIVGDLILNFIEIYTIDTVFSFDRYGVSNHVNHSSLFYALAYLCLEKKLPKRCKAYVLESVSMIRKFLGFIDLPFTYLLSSKKYVVPMDKRNIIRQAMRAHKSQYIWFRKLYMYTSRYIFVNSFKEIDAFELELEMDEANL